MTIKPIEISSIGKECGYCAAFYAYGGNDNE